MIHIKRIILLSIVFLLISLLFTTTSCNNHLREKNLSGIYLVDFKGFKGVDFNLSDTIFTTSEKEYYSNFKLIVNYDKTFYFSKPFYNGKCIISGHWKYHPDPLMLTFILKGDSCNYKSPIRNIKDVNGYHYVVVSLPNTQSRMLPLRKIKGQFPANRSQKE